MTKRERERILGNVRDMYYKIIKHKIGGARMLALEGLAMILAVFFSIPKTLTDEYVARNQDVMDLYNKIRGTEGLGR